MPLFRISPPWRPRSPSAWRSGESKNDKMPHLSDEIARDVALAPQTLAKLRHQWPSQSIPQAQHDHLVRHIKGR